MKERKYKPSPKEQAQEELATTIHKSLTGQLKPSDSEIIESLRKESMRYA